MSLPAIDQHEVQSDSLGSTLWRQYYQISMETAEHVPR